MVSGLYSTVLHYYNNVHMYNGHIESQANIPELDLASSPTNIITDQFAQVFSPPGTNGQCGARGLIYTTTTAGYRASSRVVFIEAFLLIIT